MASETSTKNIPATDQFGRRLRDLRISVTDRCNFRCPYCMPAEIYGARYEFLPRNELLTFEEIARLTRIFAGLGVTKARLTGGEPLIRADVAQLVRMLTSIDGLADLTLTTNGYLLARFAEELKAAGLGRITVSLDSLDDEVFRSMNGRNFDTAPVLEGIAAAERAGFAPLKINAVVQRGVNDHTVVDLARRFKGTGHIVRFIEYMDVGTLNRWNMSEVVTAAEIARMIGDEMPIEPVEPNYAGEVARRWRYVDGGGEIGIIASVSEPFCGACTRARLSTDGRLVTCLFAAGGTDLRGPMRGGADDDELRGLIAGIWSERRDRYSMDRSTLGSDETTPARIEMYQLGG